MILVLEGGLSVKAVEVFEIAIQEFDLQSLPEEDLIRARSILSLKLSEADWIHNCRKYHKSHHHPESKK